MFITHAAAQGRRYYQEDRYNVIEDDRGILVAVFDGHGGERAANDCAAYLPIYWETTRKLSTHTSAENKLRQILKTLATFVAGYEEGTTASLVYVPQTNDTATVAVIGDSPVLIHDGNGNVVVGPEHNVRSNKAEAEAVRKRGGFISGGYAFASYDGKGLQMSRALGDVGLSKILSCEPEIYEAPIGRGGYVLVATDGLFDPGHESTPQSMSEIKQMIAEGADAQTLVNYAVNFPTYDNVTAILIRT